MPFNRIISAVFFTILSFFYVANVFAQSNYKFEHIELPSEITDSKASCILEDSEGFLYFGVGSQLVIYDGYKGKNIACILEDGEERVFGSVDSLIEDIHGKIWVGTSNGVYIYDPIKETSVYLNDIHILEKPCRSLNTTLKGDILIGTQEGGLFIFSSEGVFKEQYIHQSGIENSLSNNIVRCTFEDKDGNIWIGTYDKLNLLNRKKKELSHFKLQKSDSLYHSNNLILSIESLDEKNDTILLVGTETGLCLFNTLTHEFTQYRKNETDNSISNSVVKSICKVDDKLWLGTDLGLNIFNVENENFTNYFHDFNNSYTLSSNVIWDIYFDSHRNLWLATDSGIDKIYLNSNDILLNQLYKNSAIFKSGVVINNFSKLDDGNIWIATQQGAFKFDSKSNSYTQFLPPEILHNKVDEILYDENGFVWIASSGGLNKYDIKKKEFRNYVAKLKGENVLTTNYIRTISQDSKGTKWIGTFNEGIFKIIEKKNGDLEFVNFKHETGNDNSLASNSINDIAFDENDNVWIATSQGITCFYVLNGVFENFTNGELYGDGPQTVNQLFFDKDKTLWMPSYNGLFQWNPKLEKFTHIENISMEVSSAIAMDSTVYFTADKKFFCFNKNNKEIIRIPNDEIGLSSITEVKLLEDETMLLSGKTGFAILNVKDLNFKEDIPTVKWTNLSISNVDIKPYTQFNSRYIIDKNIDNIDELIFEYSENSFQIDFSAFPNNSKESTQYMYLLEGYEKDWQAVKDGQNFVSFTQVRPGSYKLKVKASNKQGLFLENERLLNIVVKPPIYLSWWALLFYFGCIALLFVFYKRLLLNRERDRNELEMEKLDHHKSEELIALKTRFFTNITHELKTPLTLISSPIDDLLTKQLDEPTKKSLTLIKRNTDRLKKLVNQILDIRKMEVGGERLLIQRSNIVNFCERKLGPFKEESIKRNIFLQFSSEFEALSIWFDKEKVEKILYNLLSNAFKFTPNNGLIKVSIEEQTQDEKEGNYIYISVSDTGVGIQKEDQVKLFDRFNSLSSPNYTNQRGTGIGLSLANEYAVLHNGAIKFESILNVGSRFIFSIPKDKSLLENYDEVAILNEEKKDEAEVLDDEKIKDSEGLKVLIVEDDTDMRTFLSTGLSDKYTIIEAADGKEGFKEAISELPDIVVSDLMMPIVDGIEFCKKLKADIRTCHIPFILLTAKTGLENKMSGIEIGAEAYIEKPFNMEHLKVRIKSLIKQRDLLRKVFKQRTKLEPSEVTVTSLDEKFLDELLAKVEMEMDNSDLNVKVLSKMLGVSSTNLYRKIKGLTGQTATEFIRNIRLKRAAQLLKKEELNVSEVMYMVGFTHASYFTRCFKDLFGVSPKSYGKEHN